MAGRTVERNSVEVHGGRIDVWLREDGLFGVTLFPSNSWDRSYTSAEAHSGFPTRYSGPDLVTWGRARSMRETASS